MNIEEQRLKPLGPSAGKMIIDGYADKLYRENQRLRREREILRNAIEHHVCDIHIDMDSIFIRHIKTHLDENQEVICKICGKSAREIINEALDDVKEREDDGFDK